MTMNVKIDRLKEAVAYIFWWIAKNKKPIRYIRKWEKILLKSADFEINLYAFVTFHNKIGKWRG